MYRARWIDSGQEHFSEWTDYRKACDIRFAIDESLNPSVEKYKAEPSLNPETSEYNNPGYRPVVNNQNYTISGCHSIDEEWYIETEEGQTFQLTDLDHDAINKLAKNGRDIAQGWYNYDSCDFDRKWRFSIDLDLPNQATIASPGNAVHMHVNYCEYWGELPKYKPQWKTAARPLMEQIAPKPEYKHVSPFSKRQHRIIDNAYKLECEVIQERMMSIRKRMQMSILTERSTSYDIEEMEAYQYVMKVKYPYANRNPQVSWH